MKRYNSVLDLVRGTCDKKFVREFEKKLQSREILKQLLALRVKGGLTQKDVAKKMKCTQQNVARIENKPNDNCLSVEMLRAYATAIGYKMEIKFEKVENVKIPKN